MNNLAKVVLLSVVLMSGCQASVQVVGVHDGKPFPGKQKPWWQECDEEGGAVVVGTQRSPSLDCERKQPPMAKER